MHDTASPITPLDLTLDILILLHKTIILQVSHLNISNLTIKDDGNFLKSLALCLEKPSVGDETLDGEDGNVDKVVLPANVVKANGLQMST